MTGTMLHARVRVVRHTADSSLPVLSPKISTADRKHARTGPDTQRAQAHNHTQNSKPRTHPRQTSCSHAHTHLLCQNPSARATPTRERTRQGNHRLSELHRPLRQRLRPLPPLPLHLPLSPNLVELEAGTVPGVFLTSTIPHKVRVALRRRL